MTWSRVYFRSSVKVGCLDWASFVGCSADLMRDMLWHGFGSGLCELSRDHVRVKLDPMAWLRPSHARHQVCEGFGVSVLSLQLTPRLSFFV